MDGWMDRFMLINNFLLKYSYADPRICNAFFTNEQNMDEFFRLPVQFSVQLQTGLFTQSVIDF